MYVTPETGQSFFYNDRTKEFQWDDPNAPTPTAGGGASSRGGGTRTVLSRKASAALNAVSEEPTTVETASASTTSADPATQQPQLTPAATSSSTNESDWSLYEDPASGHVFWYNTVTQVSQWECPFALPTPSEAEHGEEGHEEGAYDEAAHKVHNDDDLGI